MPLSTRPRARGGSAVLLAASAVVLGGCATSPGAGSAPAAAPAAAGASSSTSFSTGRLVVYVTDQNGRDLDRATVDVTGEGGYRSVGTTNRQGSVAFTGVPQAVFVSVYHPGGSFAQSFAVPQNGTAEMRMILEIQEFEVPAPDAAGNEGAAGGPGGFGF